MDKIESEREVKGYLVGCYLFWEGMGVRDGDFEGFDDSVHSEGL